MKWSADSMSTHLLVRVCCSRTAHRALLAKAADKILYARLSSIVAVASAFIFAHESAVNDISRRGLCCRLWFIASRPYTVLFGTRTADLACQAVNVNTKPAWVFKRRGLPANATSKQAESGSHAGGPLGAAIERVWLIRRPSNH